MLLKEFTQKMSKPLKSSITEEQMKVVQRYRVLVDNACISLREASEAIYSEIGVKVSYETLRNLERFPVTENNQDG